MPRVRATAGANTASPMKSAQIPLNDDRQEKAQRLQSRQAAHTKQIESYKAAASPAKRARKSLGGDGPGTPSQQNDVVGNAITPMKRPVPILANFEEWMKMATDNKINLTNTWNFALIDYFHDMSLLKEGDGVNFQKASCTLDGCVKIYTSRVDSVASETGKLLSGLAESKKGKGKGGDDSIDGEGEDGDEEEGEDGAGGKKKRGKRAQRSAEATLVGSFEQLRLKKMELEFAVDPLFKKASADFDEGGAKGLLLNHLSIDATGRIVFDSSEDVQEDDSSRRDSMDPEGAQEKDAIPEDQPIDIAKLGARFFPDLDRLETQDVCPSLKTFELGSGDASLDLPFLKAPDNWRDERPEQLYTGASQGAGVFEAGDDNNFGGMDDNDNDDVGFDLGPDTGFGQGGEAWARQAHLQANTHAYTEGDPSDEGGEVGTFDANGNSYGVKLQHRSVDDQENILNYFDTALHKNWAGPEHWKIARIRDKAAAAAQPKEHKRKEKEAFEIDFAAPMTQQLAEQLYTTAENGGGRGGASSINLPKKDWRVRHRNLLPDDKHFHSRDLLRLFLKPKAVLGARRGGTRTREVQRPIPGGDEDVDEAYWASASNAAAAAARDNEEGGVQGDYDANFFQDDNLPLPGGGLDDDDDFADAREHFSPGADEVDAAGTGPEGPGIDGIMAAGSTQEGGAGDAFGANLIAQSRRLRPEYVQYARVAKKVDVRRLKEEMWKGIGFDQTPPSEEEEDTPPTPSSQLNPPPLGKQDANAALHFVDIMNNLQHVYPKQQMADISTSYGFICLLHLANEKGLVIENVDGWEDLVVRKDFEAIAGGGGD